MSRYNYRRRNSREVMVGNVGIGGLNPVRLQSMNNTVTTDIDASAAQAAEIAAAGGEIVRLTTQGVREAAAMAGISDILRKNGCDVPLVADVHFNPKAAYEAALHCEKVRINPGNFVDAARTFRQLSFTEEEYEAEIDRIREALLPFLELCRAHSTAVRLGVNHGSLSDRIMSRYGDTPAGMVESVMEFLRICREADFSDIVISIKASNTVVMTETVRLLCRAMDAERMSFPLHLGVTEAGDGEDGRVKSAVGIGSLLAEGFGDTIRVSLSEAPEAEIPVARRLRDYIAARSGHAPVVVPENPAPAPSRSLALPIPGFDNVAWPLCGGEDFDFGDALENIPQDWHRADASDIPERYSDSLPVVLTSSHVNSPGEIASWIDRFVGRGGKNPVIISLCYDTTEEEELQVRAGADLGALLLWGYGSAIDIRVPGLSKETARRVGMAILQATRLRISKTEYIACPGCGRTLFDLPATLAEVRKATAGFCGLKIGVMGCVVNGPGEMADADYGYVGAGPGRVSIYKGRTLVRKNIPTSEALPALLELIESDRGSE